MSDKGEQRPPVIGHVKWFDPAKGFGFVVADRGGPDILLHANVLRTFGQSTVGGRLPHQRRGGHTGGAFGCNGALRRATQDADGTTTPTGAVLPEFADLDPVLLATSLWSLPGEVVRTMPRALALPRVGLAEDVFVHVEVLRRAGFADLAPGEAYGYAQSRQARALGRRGGGLGTRRCGRSGPERGDELTLRPLAVRLAPEPRPSTAPPCEIGLSEGNEGPHRGPGRALTLVNTSPATAAHTDLLPSA
jgi:CspA family cold shock protein